MLLSLIELAKYGINPTAKVFTVTFQKVEGNLVVTTAPSLNRMYVQTRADQVPPEAVAQMEEGVAYAMCFDLDEVSQYVLSRDGQPFDAPFVVWLKIAAIRLATFARIGYNLLLDILQRDLDIESTVLLGYGRQVLRDFVEGRDSPAPGTRTVVLVCNGCQADVDYQFPKPEQIALRVRGLYHEHPFFELIAAMIGEVGTGMLRKIEEEFALSDEPSSTAVVVFSKATGRIAIPRFVDHERHVGREVFEETRINPFQAPRWHDRIEDLRFEPYEMPDFLSVPKIGSGSPVPDEAFPFLPMAAMPRHSVRTMDALRRFTGHQVPFGGSKRPRRN